MWLQLLEDDHLTPAEQGTIQLKGRILCGGSQESNSPVLYVGQESVLEGGGVVNTRVTSVYQGGWVNASLVQEVHTLSQQLSEINQKAEYFSH